MLFRCFVKYWFSVSDEEKERRFQDLMKNPPKRWKLSPMDLESRKHCAEYSRANDEMFAGTEIRQAPWSVADVGAAAAGDSLQAELLAAAVQRAGIHSRGLSVGPGDKGSGSVAAVSFKTAGLTEIV